MGRIGGKVHQTASRAIAPTSQRSSDAVDVFLEFAQKLVVEIPSRKSLDDVCRN